MAPARRAGWLLALLYIGYLLSFADRVLFSLAMPPIKAALHFTDGQLGILAGLAFAISYAGGAPFAGMLADRFERRWLFAGAVGLWSLATAMTAMATSFWTMFAARACVGIGEGALMLLAVSLLSDTRTGRARDRALGLFISAGAVGNVIALAFGGALMRDLTLKGGFMLPAFGMLAPWQSVFLIAGAIGLAFAAVIAATMIEPARHRSATDSPDNASIWRFIRSHRGLIATLYLGLSTVQMATVTTMSWIIVVLQRNFGWSPGDTGLRFGLTAGIAAVIGAMSFGPLIGAVRGRGYREAPLLVCMVTAIGYGLLMIAGILVSSGTLALVLMTCALLLGYGPTISAYAMMGEVLPPAAKARLAGLNTLANAIICNTLGSLLVGLLSQHVFVGPRGAGQALAIVVAIGVVVGVMIVAAGRASYRRRVDEISG